MSNAEDSVVWYENPNHILNNKSMQKAQLKYLKSSKHKTEEEKRLKTLTENVKKLEALGFTEENEL